jgi:tetratricopeptide (TPR) repeat protein
VARTADAAWAHVRLGHLRAELKQYEAAAAAYQKAAEADPELVEAHAGLGNALFELQRFEAAAEAYRAAIGIDGGDHSSLNNLAWVYAQQNVNLDEAVALSRRALQIRPDTPQYIDTLAEVYFRMGDRERAVRLIRYALGLNPDSEALQRHLWKQLDRFEKTSFGKV